MPLAHPPAGLAGDPLGLAGELRDTTAAPPTAAARPAPAVARRPATASDGQSSRLAWSVVGGPKYGAAGVTSLHAGPWTFIRCVIERSRQTLSICRGQQRQVLADAGCRARWWRSA